MNEKILFGILIGFGFAHVLMGVWFNFSVDSQPHALGYIPLGVGLVGWLFKDY